MVQDTLEEEVEMMSIMEEQRTENEFRVESDKQFHQDLLFFSLSLASPISHPPPSLAWHSLSSAHSLSLSFNYFVIDIIFLLSFVLFFVCVVSKWLCLRYDASQSLLLFVYIALLHAV